MQSRCRAGLRFPESEGPPGRRHLDRVEQTGQEIQAIELAQGYQRAGIAQHVGHSS